MKEEKAKFWTDIFASSDRNSFSLDWQTYDVQSMDITPKSTSVFFFLLDSCYNLEPSNPIS